ncbi:putative carbonic anhydrase [Helianthus annuus]|nr:putative carbonic anhydrase [Helianthus annuus]
MHAHYFITYKHNHSYSLLTSQLLTMANHDLLILIFTYLIISSLSLIITCNAHSGEHEFSYEDSSPDGPKNWGTLTTDWKPCSGGKSQSPINIDSKNAKDQPNDLKKDYKDAPARLYNKGHNIVVQWQGDAGGISINGSTYKLVQCHWHTPSEHTIDGKGYDAELHFVHSNDHKQLAVIGVLFEIGESDSFIEKMTASKFKGLDASGSDLGNVTASSTTTSDKYFRYSGSLTTPPCSEGVTWTVAEKVKTISKDQIELLKGAVDHEFQHNARPVQDLNGRTVTQFEDKEGSGASSILPLWSGIIIFVQIYILFLF